MSILLLLYKPAIRNLHTPISHTLSMPNAEPISKSPGLETCNDVTPQSRSHLMSQHAGNDPFLTYSIPLDTDESQGGNISILSVNCYI